MRIITAALAALLLATPAIAATPDFPKLTGPVVDMAEEIPADEEAALDAKLRAWQKRTGHQLVVLTMPDLDGVPIEDYGNKLIRTWGIGRKGIDDGLILIHSVGDRKVRIEVGYGLEPVVTDAKSSVIVNGTMIPRFKNGEFAQGVIDGADDLMELARYTPEELAEIEARAANERRLAAARAKDALQTALGVIAGLVALATGGWGTWRFATRKERARKKAEAAEMRRLADIEEAKQIKLRKEAQERAAERERLRVEEEKRQRAAMLAAMTPAARAAFLAEEQRQREEAAAKAKAAEDERRRLRKIADAEAKKRREEQEERDRLAQAAAASSWTNANNTTGGGGGGGFGGGGGDGGGYSGGGGSGGGGGATGSY